MAHPVSRFLPPDFDPTKPVAVIAGKAIYPVLTIEAIRRAGLQVRLIAFEGETRDDLYASFPEQERTMIKVGQLGKMLKAIKNFDAGYAMMVGQITPKRLFKGLHPDLKALAILTRLKEKNAESIFGAIAAEVEALSVQMLDARAFLDDSVAGEGLMTGGKLKAEQDYIDHGIHIAKEIARLDIGQGCVVRKGTVIAAEAFEGTDKMLRRAGSFETDELIFVKTVKAHQDYRFDVPCFGIKTLEEMKAAGISLACLETDNVLILEKEKVIAQAKEWKIQLLGYRSPSS